MSPENQTFFTDLLFYWLAVLPLLSALLVWLYFWRQKQLVKTMMRSNRDALQQNALPPPPYDKLDKPPPYTIYESFPIVHSHKNEIRNGEVILSVEDLDVDMDLPPPSYRDAVKAEAEIKQNGVVIKENITLELGTCS